MLDYRTRHDKQEDVGPSRGRLGWGLLLLALTIFSCLAGLGPSEARAVTEAEEFAHIDEVGPGAGQLTFPGTPTYDPHTSHLFFVSNGRIEEFTPWAKFVKSLGPGVVSGPVNEEQEIRVRATAGGFRLSFDGSTTPDLSFDAPGSASQGAGSIEAALDDLPSIQAASALTV